MHAHFWKLNECKHTNTCNSQVNIASSDGGLSASYGTSFIYCQFIGGGTKPLYFFFFKYETNCKVK